MRNLETNPKVEVNVVDPIHRNRYRFRSVATILRTGASCWRVLEIYRAEGADVRRIRATVIIQVDHLAPLVPPIYLVGNVVEEDIRALWHEYHKTAHQRTVVDVVPPDEF